VTRATRVAELAPGATLRVIEDANLLAVMEKHRCDLLRRHSADSGVSLAKPVASN